MTDLKQKATVGSMWAVLEKLSTHIVTFVITLILARLLTPSDYGVIALLMIFVSIAEVIADSGFGRALIQKKNATDIDYNSVFYCLMFMALIAYAILFSIAPFVANYYKSSELCSLLRVLSVMIIFQSVNSVQDAELSRKLLFNKSFKIAVIASGANAIVGISLALLKFGPWALVWGQVIGGLIGVIARWHIIAWRPRLMFSWHSLRSLFSYGWKMTASGLLARVYKNLYELIIGTYYTKADLAFVNKARNVPGPLMDAIEVPLGRVSFPVLAKFQDDPNKMREIMRKMMQLTMFLVFPIMTLCAICAETLTLLMFGEQWLPMVPFVRIMCFSMAIFPFHTINLQAIAAAGRSDLYLYLELIKKCLGIVALAVTVRFGVMTIVLVSAFVMGPLGVIVNAWPNRKLLGYSIVQQIRDVLPSTICCVGLFGVCYIESLIIGGVQDWIDRIFLLMLQGLSGLIVYIFLAKVMRIEIMGEAIDMLCQRFPRLGFAFKRLRLI